jgi:hypothetical protein
MQKLQLNHDSITPITSWLQQNHINDTTSYNHEAQTLSCSKFLQQLSKGKHFRPENQLIKVKPIALLQGD